MAINNMRVYLTWFLVCGCALSLLLGCRGVSLGMGPIGVGCIDTDMKLNIHVLASYTSGLWFDIQIDLPAACRPSHIHSQRHSRSCQRGL